MNFRRWRISLHTLLVPWAIWTLYVQVLVYAHANFFVLVYGAALPLLLGVAVVFALARARNPDELPPVARSIGPVDVGRLAPAVAIGSVGVVVLFWGHYASWALLALLAGWGLYRAHRSEAGSSRFNLPPLSGNWGPIDVGLAAAAVCLAIPQALFVVRPRPSDDTFYLGAAVSTLDFPEYPLLRYDFFYGWLDPPVQYLVVHRPQTYELTLAFIAWVTSLPVDWLYYAAMPVLGVALWAAVNYSLALRLLPARAGAILLLVALILLVWADAVYGTFDFARFFRGKNLLVAVMVPWIWLCAWEYLERPSWRRWIALACVQIVAVGLSSTGAIIGPVAAGLAIAAAWLANRVTLRSVIISGIASIPATWPLAFVWLESAGHSMTGTFNSGGPEIGILNRRAIVLALIVCLPFVFAHRVDPFGRNLRAAGVISVLYLAPLTGLVLSQAVANLSSRYVWAVPVPMLVAAGLAGLCTQPGIGRRGLATAGALVIGFVSFGGWTYSPQYRLKFALPTERVAKHTLAVARFVTELTPKTERVLVPHGLAVTIPMIPRHPVQLVARNGDLERKLSAVLSEQERTRRLALRNYASGRTQLTPDEFVSGVVDYGLYTVAVRDSHRDAAALTLAMRENGYYAHRFQRYLVFSRTASLRAQ